MKTLIKTLAICSLSLGIAIPSTAQEKQEASVHIQGDFVSSYIWRGMYQSGAALQPTLGFCIGNFSLAGWGSVDNSSAGIEILLRSIQPSYYKNNYEQRRKRTAFSRPD